MNTAENAENKKRVTGSVKLGLTKKEKDPLALLRESITVGITEVERGESKNTEAVIAFTVNEGKGTGMQVIPVSEFQDYLEALRSIKESGFYRDDVVDDDYQPAGVVARRSWRMVRPRIRIADSTSKGGFKSIEDTSAERNLVSVRTKNGQGQKPMIIHKDSFDSVLKYLEEVSEVLDGFVEQAWSNHNSLNSD